MIKFRYNKNLNNKSLDRINFLLKMEFAKNGKFKNDQCFK